MKIIKNEQVIMVDVDDTLVMWTDLFSQPHEGAIPFIDPYDNSTNYLIPHKKHINLIKKYKGRGQSVVVWSAGGYKWALSVIQTLGLENYVDLILSKPIKYIDDLQASEILGTRLYLKDYK